MRRILYRKGAAAKKITMANTQRHTHTRPLNIVSNYHASLWSNNQLKVNRYFRWDLWHSKMNSDLINNHHHVKLVMLILNHTTLICVNQVVCVCVCMCVCVCVCVCVCDEAFKFHESPSSGLGSSAFEPLPTPPADRTFSDRFPSSFRAVYPLK